MEFLIVIFYILLLWIYDLIKNSPSLLYIIKKIIYDIYIEPFLRIQILLFCSFLFLLIKFNKRLSKIKGAYFVIYPVIIFITIYYYIKDLFNININIEMILYILENISLISGEEDILILGDIFYFILMIIFIILIYLYQKRYFYLKDLFYSLWIHLLFIIFIIILSSYMINYKNLIFPNETILEATEYQKNHILPDKNWFKVKLNPVQFYFRNRWGYSFKKRSNNIVIFLLESVRKDAINLKQSKYFNPENPYNISIPFFYVPIPHSSNTHFTVLTGYYSPRKIHYFYRKINQTSFFQKLSTKNLIYELKKHNFQTYYITTNDTSFENEKNFLQYLDLKIIEKKDLEKYHLKQFDWGIDDYALYLKTKELLPEIQTPFFILYVFSNTHTPYFNPKPEIYNRYDNHTRKGRYLNTIEYTMDVIDQIMELYKKQALYKNTLFILLSDHGESFGEKGYILHDFSLYNEETLIPFVMHSYYFSYVFDKAKIQKGSILDIVPTIYDLYEIPVNYSLPGKSLFSSGYFELFLYPWGDKSKIGLIHRNDKWIFFKEENKIYQFNLNDQLIKQFPFNYELKQYLETWEPFEDLLKYEFR